jgi:hypothetical protein
MLRHTQTTSENAGPQGGGVETAIAMSKRDKRSAWDQMVVSSPDRIAPWGSGNPSCDKPLTPKAKKKP